MKRGGLIRRVVTLTEAQDGWLEQFAKAQGYPTRSEAVRELVRQGMRDPAFFVDGDRSKAHDDGAVLAREGR